MVVEIEVEVEDVVVEVVSVVDAVVVVEVVVLDVVVVGVRAGSTINQAPMRKQTTIADIITAARTPTTKTACRLAI